MENLLRLNDDEASDGSTSEGMAPDFLDELRSIVGPTPEIGLRYDNDLKTLWISMEPASHPCLTQGMMDGFLHIASVIKERWGRTYPSLDQPIQFVVVDSDTPFAFSTGGDLPSILGWLKSGDSESLRRYFEGGTRCVHALSEGFGASIITVSSVSGLVYGGGFEVARACDYTVADETARFGFPEWRFGLFPGNGAINDVGLRYGDALMRRLVLDGEYLDAKEALDLGIADRLVPSGKVAEGTRDLIASLRPRRAACLAVRRNMQRLHGLTLEGMLEETERYLSAVTQMADMKAMQSLVAVQGRIFSRMKVT